MFNFNVIFNLLMIGVMGFMIYKIYTFELRIMKFGKALEEHFTNNIEVITLLGGVMRILPKEHEMTLSIKPDKNGQLQGDVKCPDFDDLNNDWDKWDEAEEWADRQK